MLPVLVVGVVLDRGAGGDILGVGHGMGLGSVVVVVVGIVRVPGWVLESVPWTMLCAWTFCVMFPIIS